MLATPHARGFAPLQVTLEVSPEGKRPGPRLWRLSQWIHPESVLLHGRLPADEFPDKRPVRVQLRLPGEPDALTLLGAPERAEAHDGIRFGAVDPEVRERLVDYVTTRRAEVFR